MMLERKECRIVWFYGELLAPYCSLRYGERSNLDIDRGL